MEQIESADYSLDISYPAGGTFDNISWATYTFHLDPANVQNETARTILVTIQSTIHGLCSFAIGLAFFIALGKLLWTL